MHDDSGDDAAGICELEQNFKNSVSHLTGIKTKQKINQREIILYAKSSDTINSQVTLCCLIGDIQTSSLFAK